MTEPDDRVQYVREIEVHTVAEDVKEVRFSDETTTVAVGVTDDTMVDFLEAAEEVFTSIHGDMAELRDIFDEHAGDGTQWEE